MHGVILIKRKATSRVDLGPTHWWFSIAEM